MIVGFSGTQHGMTKSQWDVVAQYVESLKPDAIVHGDCVGADEQFHTICCSVYSGPLHRVILRPGVDANGNAPKRAYCKTQTPPEIEVIEHPPERYLIRNDKIAEECVRLIAAPLEFEEQLRGSGTWATVRYAHARGKPIHLVLPDGHLATFRPKLRGRA